MPSWVYPFKKCIYKFYTIFLFYNLARCWNTTPGGINQVLGQQKASSRADVEMCTVSISVSHSQPG